MIKQYPAVVLETVTKGDLELLFAWRQLLSPQQGEAPESWEQHEHWFKGMVFPYLIWYQNRRVGTVSFTTSPPWISVHVAEPGLRGKGIGKAAVEQIVEQLKASGWRHCFARVHQDNLPSHRLFSALGFKRNPEESQGWHVWRKDLVND